MVDQESFKERIAFNKGPSSSYNSVNSCGMTEKKPITPQSSTSSQTGRKIASCGTTVSSMSPLTVFQQLRELVLNGFSLTRIENWASLKILNFFASFLFDLSYYKMPG